MYKQQQTSYVCVGYIFPHAAQWGIYNKRTAAAASQRNNRIYNVLYDVLLDIYTYIHGCVCVVVWAGCWPLGSLTAAHSSSNIDRTDEQHCITTGLVCTSHLTAHTFIVGALICERQLFDSF
jgi:hypothetical protein